MTYLYEEKEALQFVVNSDIEEEYEERDHKERHICMDGEARNTYACSIIYMIDGQQHNNYYIVEYA